MNNTIFDQQHLKMTIYNFQATYSSESCTKSIASTPRKHQCVLYIHGKEKGGQKYEIPVYTFILQNNSTVYTDRVIDNVVSYPEDIVY